MKERRYRKSREVVYRKIGGNFILVPIRHEVADLESVFTLNETSARIWELIDGTSTPEEIAKKLAREFDVPKKDAKKDVDETLRELMELEAIEEAK